MFDIRKEKNRVRIQLHAARKAGTEAMLTLDEWLGILEHFNGRCAYCQYGRFGSGGPAFQLLEHILDIKKGGGTTALNCVPACISCNRRKNGVRLADPLENYKIEWAKNELTNFINSRKIGLQST